jgi:hypothetical protein
LATHIIGDIARWRACFPRARAANLRWRADLRAFAPLAGVLRVDLYSAIKRPLDDGALEPLRDAVWVDLGHCTGLRSCDVARLASVRVLNLAWCRQEALGDAGLAGLAALRELDVSMCWQAALTDAAFAALARAGTLRVLRMGGCVQASISDAAIVAVGPLLDALDVSGCRQLTDAAFATLHAATTLDLRYTAVTPACLVRLTSVRSLALCRDDDSEELAAALAALRVGGARIRVAASA